MMTSGQQAAWYYCRRRRRLKNQHVVVMLAPRGATLPNGVTATVQFMSGVTALDNKQGITSLSLSGANAADFQLTGKTLQLKAGVVLTAGVPKVVSVDATNTKKGVAHHTFTLTVT